jgi:hypothetical protein
LDRFGRLANTVASYLSKWFTDKLVLNLDKTNIIKFTTNKAFKCPLNIAYNDLEESLHTKFLGLQNWQSFKLEKLYRSVGAKVEQGFSCDKIFAAH